MLTCQRLDAPTKGRKKQAQLDYAYNHLASALDSPSGYPRTVQSR